MVVVDFTRQLLCAKATAFLVAARYEPAVSKALVGEIVLHELVGDDAIVCNNAGSDTL